VQQWLDAFTTWQARLAISIFFIDPLIISSTGTPAT
jgi:hypothetical protein